MEPSLKNYYEVLGVAINASLNDIKHAYWRLALSFHPDVAKTSQRFLETKEAYEALSDPAVRAQLDIQLGIRSFNEATGEQLEDWAQTGYDLFVAAANVVYDQLAFPDKDVA